MVQTKIETSLLIKRRVDILTNNENDDNNNDNAQNNHHLSIKHNAHYILKWQN